MGKVKNGDMLIQRGAILEIVSAKGKNVEAETPGGAASRDAAKAELREVREKLTAEFDDLTPKEVRAIEARIRDWSMPDVTRFGCRKALLEYSDDLKAWFVPGQESGA